jgi:cell filamentation protein
MDPYVYPGTSVLKNLRNIRDEQRLARFEADATAQRLSELSEKQALGKLDIHHLQSIHHHIFQDVYAWAGEFRTVNISKDGHHFGFSQHVVSSLDKTCSDLKKEHYLSGSDRRGFANRSAYYLGEINAIHPFREGNGRTQREFIRQLALKNGHSLDWTPVKREEMIEASRRSFQAGDNAGLERLIQAALRERDIELLKTCGK